MKTDLTIETVAMERRDPARCGHRGRCGQWLGVRPLHAGVLALGVLLGACSLPQAQPDPTRFYLLSAPSLSAPAAKPVPDAPAVRVRAVDLASYLRTRPLIVRRGPNEVQFREFARWGEPLEQGIARVLAAELQARGAASAVTVPGERATARRDEVELSFHVQACEGLADGTIVFRCQWNLTPADGGTGKSGAYRAEGLRWDGKDEGSLAAGLSQAVAGLAGEIAAALQK